MSSELGMPTNGSIPQSGGLGFHSKFSLLSWRWKIFQLREEVKAEAGQRTRQLEVNTGSTRGFFNTNLAI